jgi:flagellar protein FliS
MANAHDAYLENRVLSADPVELVRLATQACAAAVRDARRQLAAGDIAARSRSISRACALLIELLGSLEFQQGGEISQRLAQLYEYMHHRLIQANFEQSDEPLAEVLSLLATLSEAWDGLRQQAAPPAHPASNPWAQVQSPERAPTFAGQSWSL